MSLRFTMAALSLSFLAGLSVACASTPPGAADANLATAKKVSPPGADVFQRECAACHGKRGEGLSSAPGIMGPGALPLYKRDPADSTNPAFQQQAQYRQSETGVGNTDKRGAFRTAQDLYNYVSKEMPLPKSRAGSLTPEEYWAVVNFILVGHGVNVPPGGVNESNAASVVIERN